VIEAKDSSSARLEDMLYVPGLRVSLISIRRLCKNSLKGLFDYKSMYFNNNNKVVIYTQQKNRLYVVKHISEEYTGKVFTAVVKRETYALLASEETKAKQETNNKDSESEKDLDESDEDKTTKTNQRNYRLMHRRFAYYGPSML
jgi:hypothetical protein